MKKTISVLLIFLVILITSIPAHAMEAGSTRIVSNGETTFLIEPDGTVKGWGRNTKGELGIGTSIDEYSPVTIQGLSNIKEIIPNDYGHGYFFAIDNEGNVYAWGYNGYGQLGLDPTANLLIPTLILNLPPVSEIVINEYTTYAITTDGDVYAWGKNDYGQVGNNSKINQLTPVKVGYLSKVSSIICKAKIVFAITQDKNVYAWGRADDYQMGNGTAIPAQTIPLRIMGLSNVDEVATNGVTSFAICNNRQDVYSWGEGWRGELGTYAERNRTPVRVWTLSDLNESIDEIIIENNTCFAITDSNTLYGWGYNSYNQVGTGGTFNVSIPTKILDIPKVNEFIFNGYSGIVLGTDGCVYSWGKNPYGETGNGSTSRIATPQKLNVLGDTVTKIFNGNNSMYALKDNGEVYAWGINTSGQLGIGTIDTVTPPTIIDSILDIILVEKIGDTVFATDSQGIIYGWGNNDYGQLGDGTTMDITLPYTIFNNVIKTISGTGDVNSIVPIVGSINALTISITHPANISYAIDPNNADGFYTSDIRIQNNSKVPVRITIESFKASTDADLQLIDVLPDSMDWDNLNLEESKSFISLGLQYENEAQWQISKHELINPLYAVEINNTFIGALGKSTIGVLKLCGMHGLAFDGNYSTKHELIFIFSLV